MKNAIAEIEKRDESVSCFVLKGAFEGADIEGDIFSKEGAKGVHEQKEGRVARYREERVHCF